ncbi:hypothetical protein DZC72_09130 [Maribacter algicola]|uniref:Carboxypeptidase regulatory-like domain-containing protein n=1 Tax=Maribacter algicola TaxID=2498892 RepID=A0A3R8Q203_9FLAO|nr:hypothetical protein [Maribacter algicola]RRQ50674.1 hypothetical protein DZC72_09130 [Maribacter algicola]
MGRTVFLFFFIVTLAVFALGQENGHGETIETWENIHLHINKTTFLQGERLWFKAYVREQKTGLPSLLTTNLHVALFNKEGEQVKRKLIFIQNGLGQGSFAIDSAMTDTEYTLLAWTNYMRNFKNLKSFSQNLKIVKYDTVSEISSEPTIQISVYPEGGQLIEGAYNNIGILAKNGFGQGIAANDLTLIDNLGNVIRKNIVTNELGIGKTGFMVEPDKRYFLQFERAALPMITKELPKAVQNQISINIDNNGKDEVLIKLVGSRDTFEDKYRENYTIAIYKDEFLSLEDLVTSRDESVISFDREQLPFGVLTAILFDKDLKPIAYRMFFNHYSTENRIVELEIEHNLILNDSIELDLLLPEDIDIEINASISIIPDGSSAYDPDNSILTSFLISPYSKFHFEDYYFFENQDRRKRFELDMRLLIEGWGRYNWDSRKLTETYSAFNRENGIAFQGKIIDADLDYEQQVYLVAKLSTAMEFNELQKDKSFKGNMVLFEGDSLQVSLIGKGGKLRKPKAEIRFTNTPRELMNKNEWLNHETVRRNKDDSGKSISNQPLSIEERTISLDEVTVTDNLTRDNKFQISAEVEGRVIGDLDIKRSPSLSTYLARLGFIIGGNNGKLGVYLPDRLGGLIKVPIIIDGMGALPGEVIGLPLSSVQFLTFSKSRMTPPFISISMNKNYVDPENRNKFVKFAIENGYAQPEEYFAPDYPDYTSSIYKSYGAIYWKANVSIDSRGPTTITVPIKNQRKIWVNVEGMSSDGSLVSFKKRITLGNE